MIKNFKMVTEEHYTKHGAPPVRPANPLVKGSSLGVRHNWVQFSRETPGKLHKFSEPQFAYIWNGNNGTGQ